MSLDPLMYQTTLLLVCKEKYRRFFEQQKHVFQYELMVDPPSLRLLSQIVDRLESPKSSVNESGESKRVLCVDDSFATLSSLK